MLNHIERFREGFGERWRNLWESRRTRRLGRERFISQMDAIKATVGQQREWAYLHLLDSIGHSQDPVRTSLNILFEQNGIQSSVLERNMLTAGVEMFFGDETGERNRKLPPEIKDFLTGVYSGRRFEVDKITVLRSHGGVLANPIYEPGIMIEVNPDPETRTPFETEHEKWFISSEEEIAMSGVLHFWSRENGIWEYSTMRQNTPVLLSQDLWQRTRYESKKGIVPAEVISAICKLAPVPPIHLDYVCSTNKRIFITPDYASDFGFPLPKIIRYYGVD